MIFDPLLLCLAAAVTLLLAAPTNFTRTINTNLTPYSTIYPRNSVTAGVAEMKFSDKSFVSCFVCGLSFTMDPYWCKKCSRRKTGDNLGIED